MEYNADKKGATAITAAKNAAVAKDLGIDTSNPNCTDLELAKSHYLKKLDVLKIDGADGRTVWDKSKYDFFEQDAIPESIHPSLWLNGKSNFQTGVFSVVDKDIIQVRGFDIANLTVVRSKTGWIAVDVLTTTEMARKALEEIEDAIGEPVRDRIRAVLVSHSHTDHFGGILGVVDPENIGPAEEGKVPIYVPDGFEGATIGENVFAGTACNRRCDFQFARSETPGIGGTVSTGIGLGYGKGTISYAKPTHFIDHDCTLVIDGLTIDFQLTPGTEAPAEMNNYFRDYKALWMAENCNATMHNVYAIRGTKVRDASRWAYFINESLRKFGRDADVVFQSHNWPHWNTPETPTAVQDFLRNSAAIYKYLHDQTMHYANMGYTPVEIAHKLRIPEGLKNCWYVRPYYGSLQINARAVYQFYLGFYDGNPVNLFPLEETEAAKKFVEYVGGPEAVLDKADADFEKGEYQYAAEAANKVVFTDPSNLRARYLCADALEQLGYQSESAILRNAYLVGASELRAPLGGDPARKYNTARNLNGRLGNVVKSMTPYELLDYLGIVIDSEAASSSDIKFILEVQTEQGSEKHLIELFSGILLHNKIDEVTEEFAHLPWAGANREALIAMTWKDEESFAAAQKEDPNGCLAKIMSFMTRFADDAAYNIIEP